MANEPSGETTSARETGLPSVGWRELLAVLTLVVLCDITLYRGYGPAGHAVLVVVAPFVLLAIAVYHRLFISIGFNGMTRMRIVGLYGMTAVVVGFLLVLRKIARHHDFVWLIRRHLWTVTIAVYLLAVTPVDMIVVRYDVRKILAGDPAPCVQLSVHPIRSEGVLFLQPLLECRDATIREGIRAMLAERHEQVEQAVQRRQQEGWTSYQIADQLLLDQLRATSGKWALYADRSQREEMLKRFHAHAYQWC